MSFGLALPTGAESLAEYLDMELADQLVGDIDPAERALIAHETAAAIVAWTAGTLVSYGGTALAATAIAPACLRRRGKGRGAVPTRPKPSKAARNTPPTCAA